MATADHAIETDRRFDARALQARFAFLAQCPDSVFDDIVTLPIGSLEERVRGIVIWRDALLEGHLPPTDTWPGKFGQAAREALHELGLARFCAKQPDLVDAVLVDLVAAFSRQTVTFSEEVQIRLRELIESEKRKRAEERRLERDVARLAQEWGAKYHGTKEPRLDDETVARLRMQAEHEASRRLAGADASLLDAWSERVRVWSEIAGVFGELGMLVGRGWDLSQGVLRHVGWRDVLALAELLKRLPELREIVRSLGRLQTSESPEIEESVSERVFEPMRRLEEEWREVPTPLVHQETKGVELSDAVSRMLPSEAAMLGHPVLRYLWHARRAERGLLTYRVEGVDLERTLVEREIDIERPGPRLERGPIVAVLDTSGSMSGMRETVAKALVLEALRTAHAERRPCYLYAFSGPGQTAEQELDLSPEGIGRLLEFLSMSFHGGTDPREALRLVVKRLSEPGWRGADVLVASDGEWPAPRGGAVSKIRSARDARTRFHGVQIGNSGASGLATICDHLHEFEEWSAIG